MSSVMEAVSPHLTDAGHPLPGGVLAFLMTDIEASTQRWETAPDAMRPALARHDGLMRAAILAHGGHVFAVGGDGFHAAFASPAAAIAAALEAQATLTAEDFGNVGGLKVRMAVHSGPVEARDRNYFGPGVTRCARLLALAYGGQVLISGTAADLCEGDLPAQSSLFDLGRHRLAGVAEAEQIHQLVAPAIPSAFPPLRSVDARAHNLPAEVTSFVGREAEVAEIRSRLGQFRLVTLAGPAGAGKTRLATATGRRLIERCPDGVWFVELACLEDGALIAETVCSIVGVPVQGSRTAPQSMVGFLRRRKALIILDNCEHLVDDAARAAEAIMLACPLVSVIATSREPLRIAGETVFEVPSLACPPSSEIDARTAMGYSAVRLFCDRAAATVDAFRLDDRTAPAVTTICRHLDGIPLAIELAVPRLRIMQPEGLAARLRDGIRMLSAGSRTAEQRHQTLRELYDWSYDLLDGPEQTLLRRLSVFAGGCTLASAAAVGTGGPVEEERILDLLSSLAEKSLVRVDLTRSEPRYKLLETTRHYAFDKLRENGERGRRRRLAEYLSALYRASDESWPTTPTGAWLEAYEPELDNLRAALEWAFGPEGDARLGVRLASASLRIWDELALLSERERWFDAATAQVDDDTPPELKARLWLGRTSVSAHGDQSGFEAARHAADLFRAIDDQLGLGEALTKAGAALLTPQTTSEALGFLTEALDLLRPLGPTKPLSSCLRSLAVAHYFASAFATARPLIDESAAVARIVGDARGEANAEIALAELEFAAGHPEAAIAQIRRMLTGIRHNRRQLTLGLGNLTAYLLATGRIEDARLTAFKSLHEATALGWSAAVVRVVEHLALVAALTGRAEAAARLAGYTVAFYDKGTASREITELATYDRLRRELVARLNPIRVPTLMAEGRSWSEDRALEAALEV